LGGGLSAKPTRWVYAVDGVGFDVRPGENFGLVGESGCGKTTLGRLILRLIEPTSGEVVFDGRDITRLPHAEMRLLRKRMQIIFQDPYSSLDPRMNVESIITEPLRSDRSMSREAKRKAAEKILEKVGLRAVDLRKYPHEFSGGQRQRIGIARALIVNPELVVADEPVSALDVSIQAQVINLLTDLKQEFDLSYIFISHDLSVVDYLCDRIAVMYLGTIVELAPKDAFANHPRHPYTRSLIAAVPQPDPRRRNVIAAMEGDVPSPIEPPPGCAFHPRCPYLLDICRKQRPPLLDIAPDHLVACWYNQGQGMV
jgi:oligopeptide/dipeptide ABC transporter ATP-binding protein